MLRGISIYQGEYRSCAGHVCQADPCRSHGLPCHRVTRAKPHGFSVKYLEHQAGIGDLPNAHEYACLGPKAQPPPWTPLPVGSTRTAGAWYTTAPPRVGDPRPTQDHSREGAAASAKSWSASLGTGKRSPRSLETGYSPASKTGGICCTRCLALAPELTHC